MNEPAADHPGIDALCDLDAGLLAGTPGEADIQAHVAGCASCADFIALLATTREQLAALPAVPMPPDVAERIDAALASEATSDQSANDESAPATVAGVTPLGSARSRRPRWVRGASAVAAGIALLVAGAVGVDALTAGNEKSGTVSGAAEGNSAPNDRAQRDTGSARNYTSATLADGVRALVGDRNIAARPPQPKSASPPLPLGAQPDAVDPPDLRRLRSPAQLASCVAELTGRAGVRPLAIDYATYDGEPAVIIVLPDADPAVVQAWVVGPGCSTGNPDLRHREVVPRTG